MATDTNPASKVYAVTATVAPKGGAKMTREQGQAILADAFTRASGVPSMVTAAMIDDQGIANAIGRHGVGGAAFAIGYQVTNGTTGDLATDALRYTPKRGAASTTGYLAMVTTGPKVGPITQADVDAARKAATGAFTLVYEKAALAAR